MFGDEVNDIPWSAFRSQFLAQDDGQLISLGTTSFSPTIKGWNEQWAYDWIRANRVLLVRILAPSSKNWTLSIDGFEWTYVFNKFMAHVTGLPKHEILTCAYKPLNLSNFNHILLDWPEDYILGRPLLPWEEFRHEYLPYLWFNQMEKLQSGISTVELSFVVSDLLFIESSSRLELDFEVVLRLTQYTRDEDGKFVISSKPEYQITSQNAILVESASDRFLYALPWQSGDTELYNRTDIIVYLRKLLKWFDKQRLNQSELKPCPAKIIYDPDSIFFLSFTRYSKESVQNKTFHFLGSERDHSLLEIIFPINN